jgi:uncharacterized metal-binding protein YceD (DUF177 family)
MSEMEPDTARLPSLPFRSALVSGRKSLRFNFRPDAGQRAQIAQALGLIELPEFSFKGELAPMGRSDVVLRADLAALVVQPCCVTLAPVHTRLAEQSELRFVHDYVEPAADDLEIPAEDTVAMPEVIDVAALAIEALTLALPLYPRAKGAEFGEATFAAPGTAPLTTESLRPFAGLAGLADKLKKPGESDV